MVKVFDELRAHAVAIFFLRRAENGRRMVRGGQPGGTLALEEFTSMLGEPEVATEQRLGSRCAHANNDLWFDDKNLCVEPGFAGVDLAPGWFLVEAAFASWLPPEMLHGVGDVDIVARNSGMIQRFIKQATGGTDERLALLVFFVAWRFAEQDHVGSPRALAEDGLRSVLVQVAAFAVFGGLTKGGEIEPRR